MDSDLVCKFGSPTSVINKNILCRNIELRNSTGKLATYTVEYEGIEHTAQSIWKQVYAETGDVYVANTAKYAVLKSDDA